MEMEDIIHLYPEWIRGNLEIQNISNACSPILRRLLGDINQLSLDAHILTASADTISEWESILGITPYATDSLETRRFRVYVRINEMLPFTETWLRNQLTTLLGADGFTMNLNAEALTLDVKISVNNQSNFETVKDFLERVVPLNVVFTVVQLYNKYGDIKRAGLTYGQLSQYTYRQIRTDPDILTP